MPSASEGGGDGWCACGGWPDDEPTRSGLASSDLGDNLDEHDRCVPSAARTLARRSTARLPSCQSSLLAIRLLRGVELPDGRVVGETDRVVHLISVPGTTTTPACLMTFCRMEIRSGQVEQVAVGTGMPCEPCVISSSGTQHDEDLVSRDADQLVAGGMSRERIDVSGSASL